MIDRHNQLDIRPFVPADQTAARALILAGLGEHWGWIDETKNPDLDDIATHYSADTFLLAQLDGQIVGTGALIHEEAGTARIVRMSVEVSHRRHGIGGQILRALINAARLRGYQQLVLETTETWQDAIEFYRHHGFHVIGCWDGDMHFERSVE